MFSAGLNQSTRNTGLVSWHHKGCLSLVWFPQIYCIYLKKRVHSTLLENIFQHHFIKYHTFYGDDVFETKVDTSLVSFRSYWYSQVQTAKSIFIKSMVKKKTTQWAACQNRSCWKSSDSDHWPVDRCSSSYFIIIWLTSVRVIVQCITGPLDRNLGWCWFFKGHWTWSPWSICSTSNHLSPFRFSPRNLRDTFIKRKHHVTITSSGKVKEKVIITLKRLDSERPTERKRETSVQDIFFVLLSFQTGPHWTCIWSRSSQRAMFLDYPRHLLLQG